MMDEDTQIQYTVQLEYQIDEIRKIMDGTYTVMNYYEAIEKHTIELVKIMARYNPDYWEEMKT